MKLESLPKTIDRRKKRIGRGPGSGKGKTGGRGTKGQNARGKLSIGHPHFEGGQRSLFKRLPYKRGKNNPKISKKPLIINLEALNVFPKGQTVNLESLIKFGIVKSDDAKRYGVKILGGGSLNIPLVIQLSASKSAIEKIKKAGGKVVE